MTTYAYPTSRACAPADMEWGRLDNDRADSSPLNGYGTTLSVPGMRWTATLSYNEQRQSDRDELEAFLLKLDGVAHRVSLWDMGQGSRAGLPGGTINTTGVTTSGSTAQFATSIVLTGCGASTTLKGNSKFAIGGQLFVAADDAAANGSGVMTVVNRPMTRAAISGGAAVTLIKPTALFFMPEPLVLPRSRGGVCPAFSVRFVEIFA